MIANILKIIASLVLGYAFGWVISSITGAFVGAIPALFLREIVNSNLVVLPSLLLSLLLGVVLGFLATQLGNKIFATSDRPFVGVAFGIVLGFIVVFFVDGVFSVRTSMVAGQSFYLYGVIYSGVIGGDIGSILFPLLGVLKMIRAIIETRKYEESNRERLKEIQVSLGMNSSDKEKSA